MVLSRIQYHDRSRESARLFTSDSMMNGSPFRRNRSVPAKAVSRSTSTKMVCAIVYGPPVKGVVKE